MLSVYQAFFAPYRQISSRYCPSPQFQYGWVFRAYWSGNPKTHPSYISVRRDARDFFVRLKVTSKQKSARIVVPMRKNFVTYDGKSTVISACDEFLEMPNYLLPSVRIQQIAVKRKLKISIPPNRPTFPVTYRVYGTEHRGSHGRTSKENT
ncbi:MAG: hypothetical protein E7661_07080 [Ruminococcaceae bacterium]|nr:hypothetical protein [Oscillospiraceae bacterium]